MNNINQEEQIHSLFIGYDIPSALEMKHGFVMNILDLKYPQSELEGDVVHLIPEEDVPAIVDMIESINEVFDIGLTCDVERYE